MFSFRKSHGRQKRDVRDASISEKSEEAIIPGANKKSEEDRIVSRMEILSRKKRLAASSFNTASLVGETVFKGRGVCLKKYSDQKMALGTQCRKRSIHN